MKKLLLFMAFTSLFSLFSCTSDESEIQSKSKIEKPIENLKAGDDKPDGPGDKVTPPVKP